MKIHDTLGVQLVDGARRLARRPHRGRSLERDNVHVALNKKAVNAFLGYQAQLKPACRLY
jgi:hypothetical protein